MFSCIITRLRTYAQTRLTRIFSNFVKSTQRAALIAAEKTLDRILVLNQSGALSTESTSFALQASVIALK